MKKIFTALSFSSLIFFSSIAQTSQRKCGSPKVNPAYEEAFQSMLQKHQMFANNKKTTTVYNIPVIFHVIHSGQAVGTSYNISQAQVNSQITILNQDYRVIGDLKVTDKIMNDSFDEKKRRNLNLQSQKL